MAAVDDTALKAVQVKLVLLGESLVNSLCQHPLQLLIATSRRSGSGQILARAALCTERFQREHVAHYRRGLPHSECVQYAQG